MAAEALVSGRVRAGIAVLAVALGFSNATWGHGLDPAALTLREIEPGTFDVTWQTSGLVTPGSNVQPVLPGRCRRQGEAGAGARGDRVTLTWTVECGADDLAGETIAVADLGTAKINALLRIVSRHGDETLAVLSPRHPTFTVPARPDGWTVARDYAGLGVEHILGGVDHLLFVLGLLLLVPTTRALVQTITAFTVGHSLTLSLAALGLATVPQAPIEVVIAASVLTVAVELTREAGRAGWLARFPWAMAVAFGLLHGLGFAGALAETGLPADHALAALAAFNVGIEVGQLGFVAGVLVVRALVARTAPMLAARARQPLVYAMGILSAFWCFERLAAWVA